MYECKNCKEQITDEEYKFMKKKEYFPDGCNHQDVCECRNDDDNCICEFEKI